MTRSIFITAKFMAANMMLISAMVLSFHEERTRIIRESKYQPAISKYSPGQQDILQLT